MTAASASVESLGRSPEEPLESGHRALGPMDERSQAKRPEQGLGPATVFETVLERSDGEPTSMSPILASASASRSSPSSATTSASVEPLECLGRSSAVECHATRPAQQSHDEFGQGRYPGGGERLRQQPLRVVVAPLGPQDLDEGGQHPTLEPLPAARRPSSRAAASALS